VAVQGSSSLQVVLETTITPAGVLLQAFPEAITDGAPEVEAVDVVECRGAEQSACESTPTDYRMTFKAQPTPGTYKVTFFASWAAPTGGDAELPPEVSAAWSFAYEVVRG
jgi:hypothetical protein